MSEPIKVLIADDEEFYASCIKIILEGTEEGVFKVVGLAANGREAVEKTASAKPDVVLMDVRMPVMDGVEATRIIHERFPQIRIMILTTFDDDEYVLSALRNGAYGYVLKNIQSHDLVTSVRAVHQGTYQMSPAVVHNLVRDAVDGRERKEEAEKTYHGRINYMTSLFPDLSRREVEVLQLLLLDMDNFEIAERLCIAEQTVKNYVSLIYAKLGVPDRNHAKRYVRKLLKGKAEG